jgi:hypothetical protein
MTTEAPFSQYANHPTLDAWVRAALAQGTPSEPTAYNVDEITRLCRDQVSYRLKDAEGIELRDDDTFVCDGPFPDDAADIIRYELREIEFWYIAQENTWDAILRRSEAATTARKHLREHIHELVPALYSEAELARRAGVDRMTVRNWLGKR